ncbi:MAG TPA: hypothetical protein VH307_01810 [Streptosporangiaceae bacterium]|nr:hypothetical protein [Streptosporangiaceae bacterium]
MNIESRKEFPPGPHLSPAGINRQHDPRVRLDRILYLCDSLRGQAYGQYSHFYHVITDSIADPRGYDDLESVTGGRRDRMFSR